MGAFAGIPGFIPSVAGVTEPGATAILLTVFGVLIACSVLFSRAVDRLGVPIVLLFLLLGILGGSEGIGGLHFDDYGLAVRIGTIALVLILFDGGLNTSARSIRSVLAPASWLATAGVLMTAGIVTLAGRAFSLTWGEALLLGAVVSSTDAAAVFAVLRGGRIQLRGKVGRTIELESCVNDPMAVILTLSLVDFLSRGSMSWSWTLLAVPLQLIIGAGVGLLIGWVGKWLLWRVRIETVGLYPALTLALAFVSFGLATVAWGSGFLAVFVTGLTLASSKLPYASGLTRIHDALAWLSQVTMFLALGLLVFPSQLPAVAWQGIGLALVLALVARPVSVTACLVWFGYGWREIAYISLAGLRGAVPIVLAMFPILAQVPGAMLVFNLVFFIIVFSSLFPGALLRPATRILRLTAPERPTPPAFLEINSRHPLTGELTSFLIEPSVAVCGSRIADIEFPPGSAVVMIARDRDLLSAKGDTLIQPGDHAFVYFREQDRPLIELLFGRPESV
jgi:cell volume regulation protein A